MGNTIDAERVRELYGQYGVGVPFRQEGVLIPPSKLRALVNEGVLTYAHRNKRRFQFTTAITSWLEQVDRNAEKISSIRPSQHEYTEPYRGRARGCRKIPSLPDSDGNNTDFNSIDES